jgi:hypothetical protein
MDLDVASFSHFLSLLLFVLLKYFGGEGEAAKEGFGSLQTGSNNIFKIKF